jgi:hypothetical protein
LAAPLLPAAALTGGRRSSTSTALVRDREVDASAAGPPGPREHATPRACSVPVSQERDRDGRF